MNCATLNTRMKFGSTFPFAQLFILFFKPVNDYLLLLLISQWPWRSMGNSDATWKVKDNISSPVFPEWLFFFTCWDVNRRRITSIHSHTFINTRLKITPHLRTHVHVACSSTWTRVIGKLLFSVYRTRAINGGVSTSVWVLLGWWRNSLWSV